MYFDGLTTAFSMLYVLLMFVLLVLVFMGYCRIFQKAGVPGWAIIIPIYNIYCVFKISWGNGWYFLLMLIPLVNFVIGIMTCLKLAGAFGKSGWFGVGLVFFPFIFCMILGWGNAVYYGPANGSRYN